MEMEMAMAIPMVSGCLIMQLAVSPSFFVHQTV